MAEIEALGDIDNQGGDKSCTNKIHILREIPWSELLTIINFGKGNTGNRNSGNRNSGDWNSGDGNSGCFNTKEHKIHIFDKPSKMTLDEWRSTQAFRLLNSIRIYPTEWIWEDSMTEKETETHPEYTTTGGYLKELDTKDCCKDWWSELSTDNKCAIQNIPNFDEEKFYQITGIRV